MAREISNHDDVIDSRDVIERIEELEAIAADGDSLLDMNERCELLALRSLADEGSRELADWEHGEALIRDSYFMEYAQELADDLGMINRDMSWPYTCIDWEWAARELRMDYTPVEFDGVTYWGRS